MEDQSDAQNSTPAKHSAARFWPDGWWRIVDFKIGVVPLPVFVILVGLITALVSFGRVPADIMMSTAVLTAGGFACAEAGKRLPVLRHIGAAAIFATFIPSYLVYAHLLPMSLVTSITDFTRFSNFLYLFIAAIVVGSILGMDRRVLVSGFVKIFAPLALGSLAAIAVGSSVGAALGLGFKHSFFFIVAPIMAGGVGEGAIPLSVGYGLIQHRPSGEVFAQILPPAMLGSLTAILLAGALNFIGKRVPSLTGEGRLQSAGDDLTPGQGEPRAAPEVADIAAAGVTAVTLYLIGVMTQRLWNWPAPVTMLAIALLLKLSRAASPRLESGAAAVYQFFSTAVTYPLLFAIGVAMTPWNQIVAAFTAPVAATIIATVATMMGTGFLTAFAVRMFPIDVAIVNACHSGQGGTGDVAILTASNRMRLMPFAQIATRIGGAITVTITLIALARLS
jgi:malate:Na+ symporter